MIIECVPNISEGRNLKVIDKISSAISSCHGVNLLHVDPSIDANRSVLTFSGNIESIAEAAFRLIEISTSLIDMRLHHGAHPRLGAVDVCPFVPLVDATMKDCIMLAEHLGQRVGTELNLPVYLYGEAARRSDRKSLADIRRGEYEKLPQKMQDPRNGLPDFGPCHFNARSGATIIGARPILIAFNVNLNTKNENIAKKIARVVRESRLNNQSSGIEKDKLCFKSTVALPYVRAIGWQMESFACAQVSMNLINYRINGLHHAFDVCRDIALQFNTEVTGSELVGMLPEQALLDAGMFYAGKDSIYNKLELMEFAINKLGLSQLSSFKLEERVLEFKLPTPSIL